MLAQRHDLHKVRELVAHHIALQVRRHELLGRARAQRRDSLEEADEPQRVAALAKEKVDAVGLALNFERVQVCVVLQNELLASTGLSNYSLKQV